MGDVPIVRYGGKGEMAPRLWRHFASAHTYVEPFFGGGGMFFQIPRRYWQMFMVNDLEQRVVNFFKQLRDNGEELQRVCTLTPYSRAEYSAARELSNDPLEEARRFFVVSTQSFGGDYNKGHWSAAGAGGSVDRPRGYQNKAQQLLKFTELLKGVAIDSRDAAVVVRRFLSPDAFIYSDPPYVHATREGAPDRYVHEMTDEQHRELAAAHYEADLSGAKVCISGYASALYAELYKGWRTVDIQCASSAGMAEDGARPMRTERLWMNYPESAELGVAAPPKYTPKTARERQMARGLR